MKFYLVAGVVLIICVFVLIVRNKNRNTPKPYQGPF